SRLSESSDLSSLTTPSRYFFPFSFCENNWPAENPRMVMNVNGSAMSTNSARRSRSSTTTSFLMIFQKFIVSVSQLSPRQFQEKAFEVVPTGFDRQHIQPG